MSFIGSSFNPRQCCYSVAVQHSMSCYITGGGRELYEVVYLLHIFLFPLLLLLLLLIILLTAIKLSLGVGRVARWQSYHLISIVSLGGISINLMLYGHSVAVGSSVAVMPLGGSSVNPRQ